jgi:hypothetical protein
MAGQHHGARQAGGPGSVRTPWSVLAGVRLAGGANRPPGAVLQGAGDERWTAEDRGRTGLVTGPGVGMATYRTVIDSL